MPGIRREGVGAGWGRFVPRIVRRPEVYRAPYRAILRRPRIPFRAQVFVPPTRRGGGWGRRGLGCGKLPPHRASGSAQKPLHFTT